MQTYKNYLLAGLIGFCGFTAHAGELEDAKKWLSDMRTRIDFIRRTAIHQQDEGRLVVLDIATANVLQSIEAKGLLSVATLNLYKHLVVKFRYSSLFFEFIRTPKTEQAIAELLGLVADIRKKLEIDEDPYSTILKSNLSQMLEAIQSLRKMPEVAEPLKKGLEALVPDIGHAISLAELGDRPLAFTAATELFFKVQKLYPDLQGVGSSVGYSRALEILGLNEFIGEYAQIQKP